MNLMPPRDAAIPVMEPSAPRPFEWVGDLTIFLSRNRRLLATCLAASVLLAFAYLAMATPRFTASTTLLVDTRQAEPFDRQSPVVDAQVESALIESEVEVLHSPALAREVVARLDLANDPAFAGRPSLLSRLLHPGRAGSGAADPDAAALRQDRLVRQLQGMVDARRIGLTYIIEIDATATDRALAARLANGLAHAYLASQLASRDAATRAATAWMEPRLAAMQDRALKADQEVAAFKARSGIVETKGGMLDEQGLAELNSQLVAARARTAEAEARLGRIEAAGANGAMVVADELRSPVIDGLRERYLADADKVAAFSARYGRDHQAPTLLREEMAALQSSIASETRRIAQSARSDVAVARAGQAALEAQLASQISRNGSNDTARATLRSLQSAADTYRALYVALLQRSMQTAESLAFPTADARIVSEARPPLQKSRPQGKLILAAAIVLGLGAGFAIALLREALDLRVRRPGDLTARTGLPCIATLPRLAGAAGPSGREALDRPETPFADGIARLQLRLEQNLGARGGVIGLVAPGAGAGTSTVCANLAACLAAGGREARLLALPDRTGTPPEQRARLRSLRDADGIVLVDFPPLARPGGAHLLLSEMDQIVVVLEAGRWRSDAMLEALAAAGLDRRRVSGVVLTHAEAGA